MKTRPNLTREILQAYARAQLERPTDRTCHACAARLLTADLFADKCHRCNARPSDDMDRELPF